MLENSIASLASEFFPSFQNSAERLRDRHCLLRLVYVTVIKIIVWAN